MQLPDLTGNTSFSKITPGMQIAIDSTSLGEFKTCPKKYFYSILLGLQPVGGNEHLQFGLWMHQAREKYDYARFEGLSHDDAVDRVLDFLLKDTWNQELGRPWISGHELKNRKGLIQTAVWYLDSVAQHDNLETVALANGKPAVELSFRLDSGLRTREGEIILFCGHLDRIATMGVERYIVDPKTASSEPGAYWAKQFTPGNQFSMYMFAGRNAFGDQIKSLIVDGIQVGVNFSRFQRHLVPRDEATIEEWYHDAAYFVRQMEECAVAQHWPMNDKSCSHYGGCPFQELCAKSPGMREQWMKTGFTKRSWDPLQIRGDV